jgi:hypothetical protein
VSPALNSLAAEAQEDKGEVGASSLGSGGGSNDGGRPSGSDSDSRYVCVDNNNVDVPESVIPELQT